MNERERWIVYPLLFLTLGVSMRDQIFDRTWSKNVICEELVMLEDVDPQRQQLIGSIRPNSEPLSDATPVGHLRIGTVHAQTVIADRYLSNARIKPGPALMDFLKSLRLSNPPAQVPNAEPVPKEGALQQPRPSGNESTEPVDAILPETEQVPGGSSTESG